jgi:hypothetical protein
MSIGLFVEGKSDKDTVPRLIRKLFDTPPKIIPRMIHSRFWGEEQKCALNKIWRRYAGQPNCWRTSSTNMERTS